ncbi:hypothetical protein EKK58_12610 [Candidatus Dependentiae bacterium]|nr:MAG: hypothetical protein EKK58_12610 [Candidatus Dependentiae bacterium]
MAWRIRLKTGEFLDTPEDLSLGFEMNNQVFADSNSSLLPGTFEPNFTLPLTQHNRVLLNYPDLVNNISGFQEYDVQVFLYGQLLYIGTLIIKSANPTTASCKIISNPLRSIKSVKLNQIDLGGDREIGNSTAMLAHAKDTAQAPLDYDYVFFPIYNPTYLNSWTDDDRCKMQNHYDPDLEVFQVSGDYPALMPFVRVEYLIARIFSQIDAEYTFENRFHTTDELKRIVVWNGYSLWRDALTETINLKNHVPQVSQTEWLKKFMGVFCLGLFPNIFDKTIKLIPLKDILSRSSKHNWTEKLLYPITIDSPSSIPQAYDYADYDETGPYSRKNGRPKQEDVLGTYNDADELQTAAPPAGIYYLTNREWYVLFNPDNPPSFQIARYYDELGPAPVFDAERVFEIQMQPMHDFWPNSDFTQGPPNSAPRGPIPFCNLPGDVVYTITGETDPIAQTGVDALRWLIYRGMQPDLNGNSYPCACAPPYDAWGDPIDTLSTRLGSPVGIYGAYWQQWHNMLLGKNVPVKMALHVNDLVAFSFEDKVRIGSMDYFVKKLQVGKPIGNGYIYVDAQLVSII